MTILKICAKESTKHTTEMYILQSWWFNSALNIRYIFTIYWSFTFMMVQGI